MAVTKRGRRSSASISLIAGGLGERAKAPDDLSKEQVAIWDRVVSTENPEFFQTAVSKDLLAQYCRHASTAQKLSLAVDEALDGDEVRIKDLNQLLAMRDRESKTTVSIATKLRLTNQSRFQRTTAGSKAAAGTGKKLWSREA